MKPDYCPMANEPCQSLCDKPCSAHRLKVATTPPQRTWVGLTDEERDESLKIVDPQTKRLPLGLNLYAAAIEAKLKQKNGYAEEKNT